MRTDVEGHHPVQELFGGFVAREEGVSVHEVELAF